MAVSPLHFLQLGSLHFSSRFVLSELRSAFATISIDVADRGDVNRVVGLLKSGRSGQRIGHFGRDRLGTRTIRRRLDGSGSAHVSEVPRFVWAELGSADNTEIKTELVLRVWGWLVWFAALGSCATAPGAEYRNVGQKLKLQRCNAGIQEARRSLP